MKKMVVLIVLVISLTGCEMNSNIPLESPINDYSITMEPHPIEYPVPLEYKDISKWISYNIKCEISKDFNRTPEDIIYSRYGNPYEIAVIFNYLTNNSFPIIEKEYIIRGSNISYKIKWFLIEIDNNLYNPLIY